jgi:hypothetical protein
VGHPYSSQIKSHRYGGVLFSVLLLELDLYFQCNELGGVIWQVFEECWQASFIPGRFTDRMPAKKKWAGAIMRIASRPVKRVQAKTELKRGDAVESH